MHPLCLRSDATGARLNALAMIHHGLQIHVLMLDCFFLRVAALYGFQTAATANLANSSHTWYNNNTQSFTMLSYLIR